MLVQSIDTYGPINSLILKQETISLENLHYIWSNYLSLVNLGKTCRVVSTGAFFFLFHSLEYILTITLECSFPPKKKCILLRHSCIIHFSCSKFCAAVRSALDMYNNRFPVKLHNLLSLKISLFSMSLKIRRSLVNL